VIPRHGAINLGQILMPTDEFIGYVGNPDFHDGTVVRVRQEHDCASVSIRGASGQVYVVLFLGITAVRATDPEGMMIDSMTEMRSQLPVVVISPQLWTAFMPSSRGWE
jgi:hypothetical protein